SCPRSRMARRGPTVRWPRRSAEPLPERWVPPVTATPCRCSCPATGWWGRAANWSGTAEGCRASGGCWDTWPSSGCDNSGADNSGPRTLGATTLGLSTPRRTGPACPDTLGPAAAPPRTLADVSRVIDEILQRGADGGRITPEEALLIYTDAPLHPL